MRAHNRWVSWAIRTAVFAFAILTLWRFVTWPLPTDANGPASVGRVEEVRRVERVIDGDTLDVAGGRRIRLIGIDTPEFTKAGPEPFAAEAFDLLRSLTHGRSVKLEFDRERVDRYGRELAYVWIGDDLINEQLVRAGYAQVLTRFDYRQTMKQRFLRAQNLAKEQRRGLWATRIDD